MDLLKGNTRSFGRNRDGVKMHCGVTVRPRGKVIIDSRYEVDRYQIE